MRGKTLLGALLLVTCESLTAAEPVAGLLTPGSANAVSSAVKTASSRLRRPGCLVLLGSYMDEVGRSLDLNLETLGAPAADYVGWLVFRAAPDGAGRCRDRSNVLFTVPGSRVVFVCGERFTLIEQQEPDLAAALVVHEMLHSLGLGENPPSPSQITARVKERCSL